ncbi:alpha/beta hydrolase [Wenjunlia tyrosinilytica]|uniref:alpha/beta hydrolase n=1 Tax=Wenjunlia tyrosinilytica TaxID=1544741 RepID=UPI001664F545|nr:alpha/beta hydrolase [Wenjunlia tyrosinilytica]
MRAVAQDVTSPGRALLALAVVFLLLATSGWTAQRHLGQAKDPRALALSAWLHGSVNAHRLPRPDAPPQTIAHFFATLTAHQRARLAHRYPLVVGNLNGAPATLRYRANRISIHRALKAERRRQHTALLNDAGRWESRRRVHRYLSLLHAGRQIFSFDPSGRGKAAEVFGNLNTADRVSVLVPGVDVDLLSFERTDKPRTAPVGMARSLYNSARRTDPKARIAMIAWADYRTPVGIGVDAATGTLASQGADRLEQLVAALPRKVSTSLFCHSYGSVVCGMAAAGLPKHKVSDIAVFGSPGMRVDRASDLHTDARVWAARDPSDWIEDVPHLEFAGLGHGADPVSPGFGARVVDADNAHGHAGYLEPGTASLRNFARLAVGKYWSVSCATGNTCTTGIV